MPLITRISSRITPSSSQGSQRPWRSLPRRAPKQEQPATIRAVTTGPTGPAQRAATRSGTPGRKRLRSSGISTPASSTEPVSSSRVLPTTIATSATTSSRNCQERVSSTGRK